MPLGMSSIVGKKIKGGILITVATINGVLTLCQAVGWILLLSFSEKKTPLLLSYILISEMLQCMYVYVCVCLCLCMWGEDMFQNMQHLSLNLHNNPIKCTLNLHLTNVETETG